MPAVSKKQQRFFGYLLSNPDERKKRGISKKAAKDFAQSVDEAIERQAKDRKKLSQPHSVSGSRRDHSHDVDSALTDHVPGKGKGRIRKASKKEMRVSAMRDAGIDEAVKGQDTESRREGAKERAADKKSGKIRKNTLDPKDYATQEKKSIEWHDKRTKGRYSPGQVTDVHEVAPPGWGHTKAEKEKTKPWKPKSKIGGTAAAFKRALDDGRFKGLPGSKTKKEKTADMFKLMWSMKKKGDKPHYKPGTDEKYEKYKDKDETNESFVLEREDSPYERASDKALDKKYGYGTSYDKGPKTGFGRASNRATAAAVLKDIRRRRSKSTSETRADAAHKGWSHTARTSTDQTPEKKATRKKLADTPYKKLPKDEQEKDQVAADAVKKEYDKRKEQKEGLDFKTFYDTAKKAVSKRQEMPKPKKADDAGARARRLMQRKEYKSKVSVIVPPELED